MENVASSKRIWRDARPPWVIEAGLCQGSPGGLVQETATELLNNDLYLFYPTKVLPSHTYGFSSSHVQM